MIGLPVLCCQDMQDLSWPAFINFLQDAARRILAVLLLAAVSLYANAAPPRPGAQVDADNYYEDGHYATAADAYLQAATLVPPPDRPALLIRAAEAALLGDRRDLASQTLQKIDPVQLTQGLRVRMDLVLATLGQLPGGPEDWLQRLPPPGKDADPDLAERLWAARADSHLRLGDIVEAVHARVLRESLLKRKDDRVRNQAQIWNALGTATTIGTQFQTRTDLGSVTLGWLELAKLQRAVWSSPAERANSLDAWEWRYPDHPAADTVLDLVRRESSIIAQARSPMKPSESVTSPASIQSSPSPAITVEARTLALILPLSGSLSGAGRAVRDGFLAAWFEQPVPRPQVLILDSGSGPDSALAVYESALVAGADMVVGPLSKNAVAILARMITPGQPVLALNYLEASQAAPVNFYQFGLAPEDEAQQVAERALADGHRRAVALVPEGDWGSRTLAAFRERFEKQGGRLLDVQFFQADLQDFSEPVQRLLNLEDSARRGQSLNSLLGNTVEFSASPASLPDFVFIAAQPQQARLIRPQFRFQGADRIPLYATSLVYEGTTVPARDADLDDIRFCDMPFLLGSGDAVTARKRIRTLWSETFTRYPRLYAFGFDAAKLALNLAKGGRDYRGMTGHLRVSGDGRVHRGLLWAQFQNGRPQLLGEANAPP